LRVLVGAAFRDLVGAAFRFLIEFWPLGAGRAGREALVAPLAWEGFCLCLDWPGLGAGVGSKGTAGCGAGRLGAGSWGAGSLAGGDCGAGRL